MCRFLSKMSRKMPTFVTTNQISTDMIQKLLLSAIFALIPLTDIMAQSQTIRVFSHRGGRMERDENTLKAFQESWDAGYTGFETDIRMSKDGVCYMTHDATLDRTTNGTGVLEEKLSSELDTLLTKKGNPILRMEQFVEFLHGKDSLYVEWELKSHPAEKYPQERLEEYAEKIYQAAMSVRTRGSQMVFTSSDYRGLRYLQEKHPDAELLLIVGKPINDETIAMAKISGIKTLGCTMDGTSRAMVEKAHKEGINVSLWPGNSIEDFMLGAYLGADRLCTDIPLTVMKWQRENAPWLKVKY